jgi:lipid-binding SYLF domain-containing protein
MRSVVAAVAFVLVAAGNSSAQVDERIADRFWESAKVIEELVGAPDGGIPQDLLRRAECVGVIPAMKRAAFGFGGRYGRGLVTCRTEDGVEPWGAPSMVSISGGSFGLQIGGQSTDVLMLFVTPESIRYLLRDEMTLGADASVAAGPTGRGVSVGTSPTLKAEILTYAKSRGLFAGISLEGAVLRADRDANEELYGGPVDARRLLIDGNLSIPEAARTFVSTLTRLAARSDVPGD